MTINELYGRLEKAYCNLESTEKRKTRLNFKRILEKSTIPLDNISQNVFQTSIKVLAGKNDKWRNLSKVDKASIISFSFSDDKEVDEFFLKVIHHIFLVYIESKEERKGRGENWDIIYCGRKHKVPGIDKFFKGLGSQRKKFENNLYVKFDIASSTMLFSKYFNKFPEIQECIINNVNDISKKYNTEMFYPEGDALYFIFKDAYNDYPGYCKKLTLFTMEVLQWMTYYNIYSNPFDDDISLKIIWISNPITNDIDDQNEKAINKLTLLEKKYIEPGNIYIDEFIASKLPSSIASKFSIINVFLDGSQKYYYYTMNVHIEKLEK